MGRILDSLKVNGDLDLYLKEAVKLGEEVEFEWIYGDLQNQSKTLTKDKFIKLKDYLTSSDKNTIDSETNDLDIRTEFKVKGTSVMSNIRATIEGLSNIKQYCLNDSLDDLQVIYIKKNTYKDPKNPSLKFNSIKSQGYPCRVNLKQEMKLDIHSKEVDIFTNNWEKKNKFFRYKKRFSFVTINKLFRIDLTIVKSSDMNNDKHMSNFIYSKSFREANILNKSEQYELEIEYIGSISNTFAPPPIYNYEQLHTISPYMLEETSGNVYIPPGVDDAYGNDTTELYLQLSPRYDDGLGIEFDEPNEYVATSPQYIPDKVTIKEDYWKQSKQDDLYKHIEDNKRRFWNQDWSATNYIFIPRYKKFIHRNDMDLPRGDYIHVEISPTCEYMDVQQQKEIVVKYIDVPIEYIYEYIADTDKDEYSPDSPKAKVSIMKGGGPFNDLYSKYYTPEMIHSLQDNLELIIDECYTILYDTPYYLDTNEEKTIINEYIDLVDSTHKLYKNGWYFMGPQPVSMKLNHLNPDNQYSIVGGYVVTDKADGIRAQLFINKESRGYLITAKKVIYDTGINFEKIEGSWLFDGEYITKDKYNKSIKLFMIFDVYYSSTTESHPYTFPWKSKKGESREKILSMFKHQVEYKYDESKKINTNLRISYKQYLKGPLKLTRDTKTNKITNLMGIFKASNKIISREDNEGGFEYETDGLIFLPMNVPVKSMSAGDIPKSISGTWDINYKWKPPEENTIDFRIKYHKTNNKDTIHPYSYINEDGSKQIEKYQKIELLVGYDEKEDKSVDFNWALITNKPWNKHKLQYFKPQLNKIDNIHITNIPLTNKRMKCLKDNKDIKDGDIVEMRYNNDSNNGFTWTPLRIRDDKKNPQFFKVANNVWETITEPVTTDMICGNDIIVDYPSTIDDDLYYQNNTIKNSIPIRDLHNYIKNKLITRILSSKQLHKQLNVVDLSCGRGGDNMKYTKHENIKFYLGLDISSNVNEAAQRYYHQYGKKPVATFLQYDTSKDIKTNEGCLGDKDLCKTMLNAILGKEKSFHKQYKDIHSKYVGIGKDKFDVISSQFSLHYYFKDEETLRGLCRNLKYLCAEGGYFIGTCYDGMKVFKTFEQSGGTNLFMNDKNGNLIYDIQKKYTITDFKYDKTATENMFGKEIDVYMSSIGKYITEYLVNFEYFIEIMKEYGFTLNLPTYTKTYYTDKKGIKYEEYNLIQSPIESFDSVIKNIDELIEVDNHMINNHYSELSLIQKEETYTLLSGLNNWFAFQRVS